jgi:hypothetical protein
VGVSEQRLRAQEVSQNEQCATLKGPNSYKSLMIGENYANLKCAFDAMFFQLEAYTATAGREDAAARHHRARQLCHQLCDEAGAHATGTAPVLPGRRRSVEAPEQRKFRRGSNSALACDDWEDPEHLSQAARLLVPKVEKVAEPAPKPSPVPRLARENTVHARLMASRIDDDECLEEEQAQAQGGATKRLSEAAAYVREIRTVRPSTIRTVHSSTRTGPWHGPGPAKRFFHRVAVRCEAAAHRADEVLAQNVLRPEHSLVVMWHVLMMVWVLLSAVQVPFRLAFNEIADHVGLDYAMELCFMADVVLNFQLAYQDPDTQELVVVPHHIRARYLRSWFLVDVLSSIPVEIMHASERGLVLRVLRLCKVFRLLRLVSARGASPLEDLNRLGSRVLIRDQALISPSLQRLFKLVFAFFFVLHFSACGYWYLASQVCGAYWTHTKNTNESSAHGFTESWCPRYELWARVNSSWMDRYVAALHWSVLGLIGSDMYPTQTDQRIFTTCIALLGIGVFSTIIASASSLLANMDTHAEARKAQIDSIRHFMTYRKVAPAVQQQITSYYSYLWLSGQSMRDKQLFDQVGLKPWFHQPSTGLTFRTV